MPPEAGGASPRKPWIFMRRSPAAWACRSMREEFEDLSFHELYPEAHRVVSERLNAWPSAAADLITQIEQQLTRKLAERGISADRARPAQAALFDLAQDGAQVGRVRAALRHPGIPGGGADAVGVLSRAWRRAHDVAGGARPLQGLRLDAEAKRLPIDPHHGDRAGQAARRIADPHRGDARDRRIRHRGARVLQGQQRFTDRDAVARVRTPMPGSAAPSSCCPKAPIPKNSSSTPSSSCSTTRCSVSRPRAS